MFLESPPADENRLKATDVFRFSCHNGLPCFNTCCRNKHLPLSPYDVLRIKGVLGIHSDDFLARYALYRPDPESGFPVLSLKMGEPDGICPFVTPEGCAIYRDRPTACRLYPLGRSSALDPKSGERKEYFSRLHIARCHGLKEDRVWTMSEWVKNQGLLPYNQTNDKMLSILFHPKRNPAVLLTEAQQQKVMVACYNLDVFREFVFETPFLKRFEVDDDTARRAKIDDMELLNLGVTFLNRALFA